MWFNYPLKPYQAAQHGYEKDMAFKWLFEKKFEWRADLSLWPSHCIHSYQKQWDSDSAKQLWFSTPA